MESIQFCKSNVQQMGLQLLSICQAEILLAETDSDLINYLIQQQLFYAFLEFPDLFNPKRPGGAAAAHRSRDRLPFLTGSCYGHKNSWLCPYTSQLEVGKVIFLLSWQVFQKFSRDRRKITIFWDRKTWNWLFFIFFKTKVCNFVSNINDNCSQLSFEVYNVFVAQKLKILENSKHFFHVWTLATSATSRGPNFDLNNLKRVSNFS